MKKLFKWFLAFLGIVACFYVFAFVFGVWGSYEMKKRFDIGYGASTSPRLVRLEIGDKVFAIPQNHIWSRDRWQGGKVTGVNLQALLPNFEPYTEANKQEFEKPGWNRTIDLLLIQTDVYEKGKTSISRQQHYDLMLKKSQKTAKEKGPFGLTKVHGIKWVMDDDFFIGKLPDGDFYWVMCDPDGKHIAPSCKASVNYSDYTDLSYTFSKQYLSDWQTIDKKARNLIRQFEVNAKQGGE